jgi:hypothetical protein
LDHVLVVADCVADAPAHTGRFQGRQFLADLPAIDQHPGDQRADDDDRRSQDPRMKPPCSPVNTSIIG